MGTYNEADETWTLSIDEMQEFNKLKVFKSYEIEKRREQYPDLAHRIRKVCLQHGYAMGIHGSEVRDLDLIACPWIEDCSGVEELVEAVMNEIGALRFGRKCGWNEPEAKPHGRLAHLFCIGGPAIIDFSVMPKSPTLKNYDKLFPTPEA